MVIGLSPSAEGYLKPCKATGVVSETRVGLTLDKRRSVDRLCFATVAGRKNCWLRGFKCGKNCNRPTDDCDFGAFSRWHSMCSPSYMPSGTQHLRDRTKRFAFDVINLVKVLPRNIATDAIARQLIRSGTSGAANHRAAGRARSHREFVAKLGLVVEEADKAERWLEALLKCELAPPHLVEPCYREARELRAIFVQSLATAKQRNAS